MIRVHVPSVCSVLRRLKLSHESRRTANCARTTLVVSQSTDTNRLATFSTHLTFALRLYRLRLCLPTTALYWSLHSRKTLIARDFSPPNPAHTTATATMGALSNIIPLVILLTAVSGFAFVGYQVRYSAPSPLLPSLHRSLFATVQSLTFVSTSDVSLDQRSRQPRKENHGEKERQFYKGWHESRCQGDERGGICG